MWNNPPLKPDGTLDYARLTPAEVAADLYDGVGDRVYNGGHWDLEPWMNRLDDFLPDYDTIPAEPAPTPRLIDAMEQLLGLWKSDVIWYTP